MNTFRIFAKNKKQQIYEETNSKKNAAFAGRNTKGMGTMRNL